MKPTPRSRALPDLLLRKVHRGEKWRRCGELVTIALRLCSRIQIRVGSRSKFIPGGICPMGTGCLHVSSVVAIRTAIEVAYPEVIPMRGASASRSGRRIRFVLHMGTANYLGLQQRAMSRPLCLRAFFGWRPICPEVQCWSLGV